LKIIQEEGKVKNTNVNWKRSQKLI